MLLALHNEGSSDLELRHECVFLIMRHLLQRSRGRVDAYTLGPFWFVATDEMFT